MVQMNQNQNVNGQMNEVVNGQNQEEHVDNTQKLHKEQMDRDKSLQQPVDQVPVVLQDFQQPA